MGGDLANYIYSYIYFKIAKKKKKSSLHYNSTENEIRYIIIIVTTTERGNRGECRIGFPSLTFQIEENIFD